MKVLANHPILRRLRSLRCRKAAHRTEGLALAHIRSIVRRNSDWFHPEDLVAYKCPRCLQWHVGHRRKETR